MADDVLQLLSAHFVRLHVGDFLTVPHDHDAIGNAVDPEDVVGDESAAVPARAAMGEQ